MNKKLIATLLLVLFFSACTKEEKSLAALFESLQVSQEKLLGNDKFPVLTSETLALLKSYSDLLRRGNEQFRTVVKKKRSRKRISKYLVKTGKLKKICSTFFVDESLLENVKSQCTEGFFNICPASLSRYDKNRLEMAKSLQKVLGNKFSQTDCSKYTNKEL